MRIALAALCTLLLAWLVGGYFVLMHPKVDRPRHVDAILVLGPPDVGGRVTQALSLARQGLAGTVVISIESDWQRLRRGDCHNQIPSITVICFQPQPSTTQGEAREIARLAGERGWHSIMVITSTYHISRARVILKRCFHGDMAMIEATGKPKATEWPFQYVYQTGAYLKAFLSRNC